MGANTGRYEYYWENGRLTYQRVSRNNIYSQWPTNARQRYLVIAIEELGTERKYTKGPEYRPQRMVQALLRFTRMDVAPDTVDIGPQVPQEVIEKASVAVDGVVANILRTFYRLAAEPATTGLLVGTLDGGQFVSDDGWEVNLTVQGFSSEVKEPKVGADIAIIVDVREGGRRVVKAVWLQAKRADAPVKKPESLQDFPKQAKAMAAHTRDAYGIIYEPRSIYVFRTDEPEATFPLSELVSSTIRCRRGDRSPTVIANSLDHQFVVELAMLDAAAAAAIF